MRVVWCWRCRMEIPMLDDDEWAVVQQAFRLSRDDPAAADALLEEERIRRRLPPVPPLEEADPMDRFFRPLVKGYALFTGVVEDVPNAIWHHVASKYGPPCEHCGKPLRTPQARWCPACGGGRTVMPAPAS